MTSIVLEQPTATGSPLPPARATACRQVSRPTAAAPLSIILLGAGTVNGALAQLITRHNESHNNTGGDDFPRNPALPELAISHCLVRDTRRARAALPTSARLTSDPLSLPIEDCDAVVEALGGTEPARTLALRALRAGVPYITANKTLIARHGAELARAAAESRTPLLFEAAVGAATPCIRVLRETLRGVTIRRIYGVLNGTSHYVLDQWLNRGSSLAAAIRGAQGAGYAEADPSNDLCGEDAAQKLSILNWCAAGALLEPSQIERVELPALTQATLLAAARVGFTVKPLACLSWFDDGSPAAWVAPAAVPSTSPVAATGGVDASVVIQTEGAGSVFLSASGAGGAPTASALFDDLAEVAEGRARSGRFAPVAGAARVSRGGARDPRGWVIHAPGGAALTLVEVAAHIAGHGGDVRQFQQLGADGFVVHATGIRYEPSFTQQLVAAGACVLEVVE
jgi:homoserine dehydrogenase